MGDKVPLLYIYKLPIVRLSGCYWYIIIYVSLRELPCDTHVILASGACETHLRATLRYIASGRRRAAPSKVNAL